MNDKDAQLIWEAAPTEWPPPKATIVPERPTEADLLVQLQRQAQRIDVLQWEVDQLKTVMDKNNLKSLQALDFEGVHQKKIKLMTDFCQGKKVEEVPDPYFLGDEGFELVLDILEEATEGLINYLMEDFKG